MLSEWISPDQNAKVVVMFGGNLYRRDGVRRQLKTLGNITVYGALSEEEGMQMLETTKRTDLVSIGGRYTIEQRNRIRSFVKENLPRTKITESGFDYPYDNNEILKNAKAKLGL